MALRCFAKCPYRAHRWDIRQGAQEGIWRYCGKLPIRGPNHHQLGPYEPGTLAGSTHQVNGVPKACHLPGKVRISTHHRRWHAASGLLSGSATSAPTPSGDDGGWQSAGASLWVYMPGNHGTRIGCQLLCDQPSFRTDFSSAPSRPEHSRNYPVGPSSAMHGLAEVLSFGEPLKICLAPKIQWQHAFWVCGWR